MAHPTPVTPAQYDAGKRAEAAAAGAPTRRAAGSAHFLGERAALIWATPGDTRLQIATGAHPTRALTWQDVEAHLEVQTSQDEAGNTTYEDAAGLIVADRPTARSLSRFIGRAATVSQPGAIAAARRVEYCLAQRIPTPLVVLTDALAHAYWLSTGRDTRLLSSWVSAFGLHGRGTRTAMRALAAMCRGEDHAQTARNFDFAVRRAMAATGHSNLAASCAAFTATEDAVALWNQGLLAADRLLGPRLVLDGTLTRLRPVKATTSTVTCTVSQPFSKKPGRRLDLRTEAGIPAGTVTLADVSLVDGELVAVLAATRGSGRDALTLALRSHDTLLAVEAPYIAYGTQPGADKNPWHATEPPARVHREVPLDVAFAGMPDA